MKNCFFIIKKHVFIIVFSGATMMLAACEKVIDIDLNSAAPEIVIEGTVIDQAGPYYVRLSKTVNFDQPNTFPPVSGAIVTISDNLGNSDILTESSAGIYQTTSMAGVPGRNYFLKVEHAGKEYQASSSMAPPVSIDTITVDSISFAGVTSKFLNVSFADVLEVKNYYRLIEIINGDTLSIINITNDDFEDGKQITMPIFSDEDPKLKSGDNVVVLLQCIDENVYTYFGELMQVVNGGGQSSAPANPTSNINNHALGYFSAYSVTSKSIVVP
jgi:hypothetical protein